MTSREPNISDFHDLSRDEFIVLGLLWQHFQQFQPSPTWDAAHATLIASITPDDSADLRAAHRARTEVEATPLPNECYAAVQWSLLATAYRDGLSKPAYTSVMRAWRTLFPLRGSAPDPDTISAVSDAATVTSEGYFDLLGFESQPHFAGRVYPDSDIEAEAAAVAAVLAPILKP